MLSKVSRGVADAAAYYVGKWGTDNTDGKPYTVGDARFGIYYFEFKNL